MERAESALREIERERARKEERAECESLGG